MKAFLDLVHALLAARRCVLQPFDPEPEFLRRLRGQGREEILHAAGYLRLILALLRGKSPKLFLQLLPFRYTRSQGRRDGRF